MMRNKIRKVLGLSVLAGMSAAGTAEAQSSEALLKTLVRKGVITEAEADALRKEATQEPSGAVPVFLRNMPTLLSILAKQQQMMFFT